MNLILALTVWEILSAAYVLFKAFAALAATWGWP